MKKFRLFLWILFPYMTIALISIFGILIANGVLLKKCEDSYVDILDKSTTSIIASNESRIEMVQKISDTLLSNSLMNHFIIQKPEGNYSDSVDILKIIDLIKTHNFDSELVKDVYIYDYDRNIIIDDSTVYRTPKEFYDNNDYSNVVSYDDWIEIVTRHNWTSEYINLSNDKAETAKGLHFIQSIPLGFTSNISGKLIVSLSAKEIKKSFFDVLELKQGELFIFDKNGKLLLTTNNSFESDKVYYESENKRFVSMPQGEFLRVSSDYVSTGWRFVVLLPIKTVSQGLFGVKSVVVFVEILLVLLCVFFCIKFSRKNKDSLYHLFNLLKLDNNEITDLIIQNSRMDYLDLANTLVKGLVEGKESKEQENTILVKNKILRTLISGESISDDATEKIIDSFALEARKFAVMVMRFGGDYRGFVSEGVSIKDFTKSILLSMVSTRVEFVELNSREIALLFYFDDSENIDTILSQFVSNAMVSINYEYGIDVLYAVGDSVDNIYDVRESYNQAKDVLKYAKFHLDEHLVLYSELPKNNIRRFYPLEIETKMYNYIVSGNGEKAIEILNNIYEENFIRNKCSINEIELLLADINSTLVQVQGMLFEDYEIKGQVPETTKEFFEYAKIFINNATQKVTKEKFTRSKKVINDVIVYIDNNYIDSTLSLTKLSGEFNLHEHYISTKFKEYTGENFSVYLEKKRINSACELLLKNEHTINDISEMVGYTNALSFRRAFKKIMGVSPSKFNS